MARSAMLALAACVLALACFSATASARALSEDTYDNCKVVKKEKYEGYEDKWNKDYECKQVDEEKAEDKYYPADYEPTYYYNCCPKPTQAPTYAPATYDNCKVVKKEKYEGYEDKWNKDYECKQVEEEKAEGKYYPAYYEPTYYYNCCPKPTQAPTYAPTKEPTYYNCKKVSKYEYKHKKDYYESYDCKKVMEYKKGYSYYKYYKCCPKKTPAPTAAPTPKPTKYVKPAECSTDKKQKCCKVYGYKAKKEYKDKHYSCKDYGYDKYKCCKPLPKPECYYKKIGYKSRKCCYDHEKKYKKDKKYKCFYDSYKGHKGDYCYKKED